ncbi:MAG: hypothetical protein ACI9KN_002289 [Gammaproteobacteria bacterium]|jgi:hypothetical protein
MFCVTQKYGVYRANLITVFLITVFILASCSTIPTSVEPPQPSNLDYDILLSLPETSVSYDNSVKPILERRCISCHGCYDAPCQLKLSSIEGIQRGANVQRVYDGTRIFGQAPSRLMIDAKTTAEWRDKGFHTVLNEGDVSPTQNLDQSLLYQMLRLKQLNPQPRVGRLPASFDLALNREQVCPVRDKFDSYAKDHSQWGMPYAMPNLSDGEYRTLVQWIAQGSPVPARPDPSLQAQAQIQIWENFLNGSSNKDKLVSRYIYEHLFQAHIYFSDNPGREFFRLIRSTTAPGDVYDEIPTIRPYEDPGRNRFYYRIIPYQASIVAKSHIVYPLSQKKLERYRELFYAPDYAVDVLPPYTAEIASNPFKAFKLIPPDSRYRFLLDNARFFIEGFIKGPVCRGQVALNVIEDQFWVFFFDPDNYPLTTNPAFLDKYANNLQIPSERGDTFNLLAAWTDYWDSLVTYKAAVQEAFLNSPTQLTLDQSMDTIWDGGGTNPNAALTIFRHSDSASVDYGLSGDYPETTWIIDYPMLERIHYMLVAGFNVFGNGGHQLNTRIYMDFLRMEGENRFLAFLPTSQRKTIHDSWYTGKRDILDKYLNAPSKWLDKEVVTGYQTDDSQTELYQSIERHLGPMAGSEDNINRCQTLPCRFQSSKKGQIEADTAMARVADIKGEVLQIFPDLAFVRVRTDDIKMPDFAYTLIRNKAFKNVNSMFSSEADQDRDLEYDSMTVKNGLYGSYPNFFFDIELAHIDDFATGYTAIRSFSDYEKFVGLYGVRRTQSDFWEISDWFQDSYALQQPILSGLFDLNRYENR